MKALPLAQCAQRMTGPREAFDFFGPRPAGHLRKAIHPMAFDEVRTPAHSSLSPQSFCSWAAALKPKSSSRVARAIQNTFPEEEGDL